VTWLEVVVSVEGPSLWMKCGECTVIWTALYTHLTKYRWTYSARLVFMVTSDVYMTRQ